MTSRNITKGSLPSNSRQYNKEVTFIPELTECYKAYSPSVDEDGLSYISNEDVLDFGLAVDQSFTTLSTESSSVIYLQEQLRDQQRLIEREKYQHALLQNKHRCLNQDRVEMERKLDSTSHQKSVLERERLELDAKLRILEYKLAEEKEKRYSTEVLLQKTNEQLEKKENQYTRVIKEKQQMELSLQNNVMELRAAGSSIKQLKDENAELEKQLGWERSSRRKQEELEQEQKTAQMKMHETATDIDDNDKEFLEETLEKYKAEIYSIKMESERLQSRSKDDQALSMAENEVLQAKVNDLKYEVKLNEEALSQATMQYNVQLSALRTEISVIQSALDKSNATKDKLETECDLLKNRINSISLENEKIRSEIMETERTLQKERSESNQSHEKSNFEVRSLKDTIQNMQQKINASENKIVTSDNEIHKYEFKMSEIKESLIRLQKSYDEKVLQLEKVSTLQSSEKEQLLKISLKYETAQERLNSVQQENMSLKIQLENGRKSIEGSNDFQIHNKLSEIIDMFKSDNDKNRSTLEEKNFSLMETVTKLNEELRNAENSRITNELDFKRLTEQYNVTSRSLTEAECKLKVTEESKERLEMEKSQLQTSLENLREKYQAVSEKNIELGIRMSETDTLEQKDNSRSDVQMKRKIDQLTRDLEESQNTCQKLEILCENLKKSNGEQPLKFGDHHKSNQFELLEKDIELKLKDTECKLFSEKEKNNDLQSQVSQLRTYLKIAMFRINPSDTKHADIPSSSVFDGKPTETSSEELNHFDIMSPIKDPSFPKSILKGTGDDEHLKQKMELRFRQELNMKLSDVNNYLEQQGQKHDRLFQSWCNHEANLRGEIKRVKNQLNDMKLKYEYSLAEKDTFGTEAKRYYELFCKEMMGNVQCQSLSHSRGWLRRSSLPQFLDKDHLQTSKMREEVLGSKLASDLERSINTHLEAPPYDNTFTKMMPSGMQDTSEFNPSRSHYQDVLRRIYLIK